MSICLNQAGETKTKHCPPTLRPPSIQFKWYLSYRPDICPENHELYLWGKNCHVEKFQLSLYYNCGEITNRTTSHLPTQPSAGRCSPRVASIWFHMQRDGVHSFGQQFQQFIEKGFHSETTYRMTRDQGLSGLNPGAHDNQSSSLPIPRAILG